VEKGVSPDLIISSYAVRALETAKLIARGVGYAKDKIIISGNLYHADSDDILDQLYGVSDDINSVMVVGHNPGFSRFARDFDKNAPDWLPTSGVVAVNFDTEKWNEILDAKCDTEFIVSPRMLS